MMNPDIKILEELKKIFIKGQANLFIYFIFCKIKLQFLHYINKYQEKRVIKLE